MKNILKALRLVVAADASGASPGSRQRCAASKPEAEECDDNEPLSEFAGCHRAAPFHGRNDRDLILKGP